MKATLRYSLSRLAVFAAAAGALYLVGVRGLTMVLMALLVSGIVSLLLLSKQRDAMSEQVIRLRDAIDTAAAKEDGPADAPPPVTE